MGRRRRTASGALPGARLILRRSRFAELVERQLDLFEAEHAADLREAEERLERYHAAGRDEAEELYGDYLDTVEVVSDALDDVRDGYARTLDEATADAYVRAFDRAAGRRRRLPRRQ